MSRDQRPPRENKTRDRKDDDTHEDHTRSSEDHPVSKQTSRSEGKTSRGAEMREKVENDKDDKDDVSVSDKTSSVDRHEKQGSRQRLRYKVGGLVLSTTCCVCVCVVSGRWSCVVCHVLCLHAVCVVSIFCFITCMLATLTENRLSL